MSKLFILSILLLATTLATSTRILTDVTPLPEPIPIPTTEAEATPVAVASATNAAVTPIPNSDAPPLTTTSPATNDVVAPVSDEPAPVVAPVPEVGDSDAPPLTTASPATNAAATPVSDEPAPIDAPPLTTPTAAPTTNPAVAPVPDEPAPVAAPVPEHPNSGTSPLTTSSGGGVAGAGAGGVSGGSPTFSFFMHDILGGSNPSGRAVAGIVASSDANNLPFSKNSNQFFPINGGVPLNTVNGVVNNNNLPFLVGLNGSPSSTVVQSNGNSVVSGGGSQPFVTAGQLPAGLTLQQLTFGSVTVVDNEMTAGHELGSAVLGRAQGFYLTSSSDGSSHTLALTAVFHGGEVFDTVSFFGVHRTATPISHIAVVGGTGKYENAKGFAAIEALPQVDQHTTDGVETITHFTVYLTP